MTPVMQKKPRLLHWVTSLHQGGAQAMLVKLLPLLADEFDQHVVSFLDQGTLGESISASGIPVHCVQARRSFMGVFSGIRAAQIIRSLEPDIVQAWMYHCNLSASVVRSLSLSPRFSVVWNIRHSLADLSHERCATRYVIRLSRPFSRSADCIVYNSKVAREQHEAFGFSQHVGCVIPNGFNTQTFAPCKSAALQFRRQLGVGKDDLLFGHVARYHPMKNHVGFVQAAVRCAEKHDHVTFVLIGTNVTEQNVELLSQIPPSVRDRFHLLGESNDISQIMNGVDVLCLTSLWGEAFPNVLCEAMATRTPCVTSDVGDAGLIVGDSGVVVSSGDTDELLRGLEQFIDMGPNQRERLGQRAREYVIARWQLATIAERYAETYRQVIRR